MVARFPVGQLVYDRLIREIGKIVGLSSSYIRIRLSNGLFLHAFPEDLYYKKYHKTKIVAVKQRLISKYLS